MSAKKQETCLYSKEEYRLMKRLHSIGLSKAQIIEKSGLNVSQVTRFLKLYRDEVAYDIYATNFKRKIEYQKSKAKKQETS